LAFIGLLLSLMGPGSAHEILLKADDGRVLLVLQLKPQWSATAARDAVELASPNGRTRIHCLELRASTDLEEGRVFLQTMRDSLFQTYEPEEDESTELDGTPALLLRGRGMSRGFDTKLEALIFRTIDGNVCLVTLQQDVGYESDTQLKSFLSLPAK
jgi:hypothetical protein